jgi:hypothetical protein
MHHVEANVGLALVVMIMEVKFSRSCKVAIVGGKVVILCEQSKIFEGHVPTYPIQKGELRQCNTTVTDLLSNGRFVACAIDVDRSRVMLTQHGSDLCNSKLLEAERNTTVTRDYWVVTCAVEADGSRVIYLNST